ncbi:MAG: hypothetical protein WA160_02290 [Pseudobdellovibrio sp.]
MKINSQFRKYLVSSMIRFISLAVMLSIAYVYSGGHLKQLILIGPSALLYSLAGVVFLFFKSGRPKDFSSVLELEAFRVQIIRVMWCLNFIIITFGILKTMGHLAESSDLLGKSIADVIVGPIVNTIFYLSFLLTPIQVGSIEEVAILKSKGSCQ